MTIKIVFPGDGNGVMTANGTKVFNHKGDEIKDVTNVNISIALDEVVTATIDVAFAAENMDNIHAMLGTKTLEEIATAHGCCLSPMGEAALGSGLHCQSIAK